MNKMGSEFTSIGGQAIIEGVMMRSPHAFVVAVRKSDGSIRLRRDQWFGLGHKFSFLRKPFFRGVLMLIETMANGIVALNYSANIAMDDEEREKAIKKGISEEDYEKNKKKKEKISIGTFLTIGVSFLFGILLFIMLPHGLTLFLEQSVGAMWGLDSFQFHAIDGVIKACIFLLYVYIIGFMPDVKRVFQYHGAEHMSISTFEAGEDLTIENARKYSTFHPRCGTTFIFFLLFISIILFSIIFALVPIGVNHPFFVKHAEAILFKIVLTFPIAGISYELLKLLGKHSRSAWGKFFSAPGMFLQRLTTKVPDDKQLEVGLASIKSTLFLEENYKLREAGEKVISLEEIDIQGISDLENSGLVLKDFLE